MSNICEIDVARNQEYLIEIIKMANNKVSNNEAKSNINRSNLKIPVQHIEELQVLKSNDEQNIILVSILKRL